MPEKPYKRGKQQREARARRVEAGKKEYRGEDGKRYFEVRDSFFREM